jgi:hypothetical protein
MECWRVRGHLSINQQKNLPAGDALGLPIKPQYFIPLVLVAQLYFIIMPIHYSTNHFLKVSILLTSGFLIIQFVTKLFNILSCATVTFVSTSYFYNHFNNTTL